ncbi:hypothetical protein Smp_146920.1 [Schistosoma mansoni]|uniref:hypothetical protein n=1 Tax=Schistosoma mansoni TaxID=6183 RepID=UPI00022DC40D|nr:hypothetical protein Smp_146920.1 [Schistosoma mansoni]|eukprot:XP_018650613.1 hypothetical protein Smp_146920.1 [Schistosoma mansoni]
MAEWSMLKMEMQRLLMMITEWSMLKMEMQRLLMMVCERSLLNNVFNPNIDICEVIQLSSYEFEQQYSTINLIFVANPVFVFTDVELKSPDDVKKQISLNERIYLALDNITTNRRKIQSLRGNLIILSSMLYSFTLPYLKSKQTAHNKCTFVFSISSCSTNVTSFEL